MKYPFLFLTLIVLLAITLRFYRLTSIPSGFLNDEAALGYNAYSLLKTGKDEFGKAWPMIFESFGEGKPGMMVYHVLPWVAIFGLNEFAVRFSPALFSIFSIIAIYFLCLEIFDNQKNKYKIALISALILTILPWDIIFSRGGAFGQESVFWIILMALFIYRWIRREGTLFSLLIGLFSGTIAMFTYHSARVFVPLLLIGLFLSLRRNINKNNKIKYIIFSLLLVIIPWLILWFDPLAGSRASGVSLLHSQGGINIKLNQDITESLGQPLWFIRLLHNKLEAITNDFISRYISHFDASFLFFQGDLLPRYKVPNEGLVYWVLAPFLLAGIYYLIKQKLFLILYWLLFSPIPAALTFQTPSSSRAKYMIIPLVIIGAVGTVYLFEQIKGKWKKLAIGFFSLVLFYQCIYFLDCYFIHFQLREPYHWQDGYKELVQKVTSMQSKYKRIEVTDKKGTPYIFFLFFQKYDPQKWQTQANMARGEIDPYHFQSMRFLDNIYFVGSKCPANDSGELGVLYVCVNEEIPTNAKILDTINYNNGEPVFVLLELLPKPVINQI